MHPGLMEDAPAHGQIICEVPSKPNHSRIVQFSDSVKEVLHEEVNADLQSLTERVLVCEKLV